MVLEHVMLYTMQPRLCDTAMHVQGYQGGTANIIHDPLGEA